MTMGKVEKTRKPRKARVSKLVSEKFEKPLDVYVGDIKLPGKKCIDLDTDIREEPKKGVEGDKTPEYVLWMFEFYPEKAIKKYSTWLRKLADLGQLPEEFKCLID